MICTVILNLKAQHCHIVDVMDRLKKLFPVTRGFDGCIDIYASQDMDEPQNFAVIETWASREKYESYLAWRTERGDIGVMESMLEGEIHLRLFDRIRA